MRVNRISKSRVVVKACRQGAAAVEFACCLPLLVMILTGMLQIGRVVEVQQVLWNAARETARDASLGNDSLQTTASNLLSYLQGAEPKAFGQGHSTSMIAPVMALGANTTGYTCWDNTTNQELFTVTFSDITNTSTTDPTAMSQLDVFNIGVQVPFSSVALSSIVPVSGINRLYVTVVWASMVDSPFQITPNLPAQ